MARPERPKGPIDRLDLSAERGAVVAERLAVSVAVEVYRQLRVAHDTERSVANGCSIIGNCSGGPGCDIIGNCSSSSKLVELTAQQ